MKTATLLELFHAGDIEGFRKAWENDALDQGLVVKSWLNFLVREPEQRRDKKPGDMIPGGIKGKGAMDAEAGVFLDVILGSRYHTDHIQILAAWSRIADTAKERKARTARVLGWLDRIAAGMSRADLSQLLGVFLGSTAPFAARKEFLQQLVSDGRLLKWNTKAVLRPEYLVEVGRFRLEGRDPAEEIALVDRVLDSVDNPSRIVRTDISPADLLKAVAGAPTQGSNADPALHLLARLAPLFKPEVQATIETVARTPRLRAFAEDPTPQGLATLASDFPNISFEEKLGYGQTLNEAVLRGYAKALLQSGPQSKIAQSWTQAIDALTPIQKSQVVAALADTIDDVIEQRRGEDRRPDKLAGKLEAVLALRQLHPDEPLEQRSWAELAITGAMHAAIIQHKPAPRRGPGNGG